MVDLEKLNITQSGLGHLLRISLSNTCNYDCIFCHPPKNQKIDVMSNEEILKIICEINKIYKLKTIHFTGGEPLLRKGVDELIEGCREEVGDDIDIAMTTNGALLPQLIEKLHNAGLNRLNISIHSLNQRKHNIITNSEGTNLNEVLEAIDEGLNMGMRIKINSIVVRSINLDDISEMAEYFWDRDVILRFLELYFVGPIKNWLPESDMVSRNEILNRMNEKFGPFIEDNTRRGNGVAKYYVNDIGKIFGILDNQTNKYCVGCDRMRLSVDGILRFCTYDGVNIRETIKDEERLRTLLTNMSEMFTKRGNDYVHKRKHEIDYSFRWNLREEKK